MTRFTLLGVLLLLLVSCAIPGASAPLPTTTPRPPASATTTALPPTETVAPPPTSTTVPPTATLPPTATTAPTPTAGTRADEMDDPLFARLIDQAEVVRELDSRAPVQFERMSRSELRERLQKDIEEQVSPEEIAAEDALLKLLGLIPDETDLEELFLDLYESQIAGFYDPEENVFYLIRDEEAELTVSDEVTFVHEYVHALQDQYLDLDRYVDEDLQESRSNDEARAFQALVEGDAQLATTLFVFEYLSMEQIEQLIQEAGAADDGTLAATPPFLRSSLEFPYEAGGEFVQGVFLSGGWPAVDALWSNLPLSTEQILHPERYPADVPEPVALPEGLHEALGEGWREGLRDVWGEQDLRLLFADRDYDGPAPDDAAAGWDGDEFLFLTDDAAGLFVMESVWDSPEDAAEAAAALEGWLDALGLTPNENRRHAGAGRQGYLALDGSRLRWAVATEDAPLELLLALLEWP